MDIQVLKEYIINKLYPLTLTHLIYLLIVLGISYYITEYLLKIKLFKWVYVATFIVLIVSSFKEGDDARAVKDIFKLATA